MLKFTMDQKDADFDPEELAAAGIEVSKDRRYYSRACFIAKDLSPKDLNEALTIIRKAFYCPPINVWIDGRKCDPFKEPNKIVTIATISWPR